MFRIDDHHCPDNLCARAQVAVMGFIQLNIYDEDLLFVMFHQFINAPTCNFANNPSKVISGHTQSVIFFGFSIY